MNAHVEAIVVTAGAGKRFQSKNLKSLILLKNQPVFVYALQTLARSPFIKNIILVVPKNPLASFQKICKQFHLRKIKCVVPGGQTRSESVACGITQLSEDAEIVLIHDGVRPLITVDLVNRAIKACLKNGAVVTALPLTSTIKRVNSKNLLVKETLPRDELWQVQTPQVFKKSLLIKAHKNNSNPHVTDDAMLIEKMNKPVKIVIGDSRNIKITTVEDFKLAEALLKKI